MRRCWLALVLHPPEARRIVEANAAPAPLRVLGGDILGNKNDPGGSPYELIITRFRFWRDQRQQGAAVGRGDRHPAVAGLKLRIEGQIEAELIR